MLNDFIDIRPSLEVFKDGGDRHPGAAKHSSAASPVGNAFDGRALRPIQSCHTPTLFSIVIVLDALYQHRESAQRH